MDIKDLLRLERVLGRACAYEDVITRKDAAELLQAFTQLRRSSEHLQEVYEAAAAWSVADHTPPHKTLTDAQVEHNQRAADTRLLAAVDRARAALTDTAEDS
jgi:hypothetical protein